MQQAAVDRRTFLAGLGGTGALLAAGGWLDAVGYAQTRGPARAFVRKRPGGIDFDRRVLGSFLEHLGRAVYTGVYQPGSALADAKAAVAGTLQAREAAENAANEAAAKAKVIADDAKKSAAEKKQVADEAAAKRKAADDANAAISQAQQKQQQAQAAAYVAATNLVQAEVQKKLAEEALPKIAAQVTDFSERLPNAIESVQKRAAEHGWSRFLPEKMPPAAELTSISRFSSSLLTAILSA